MPPAVTGCRRVDGKGRYGELSVRLLSLMVRSAGKGRAS
jgi:hypothetical protein